MCFCGVLTPFHDRATSSAGQDCSMPRITPSTRGAGALSSCLQESFPGIWLCLGFELFSNLSNLLSFHPSPADDYQVKLPLLSPSLLCLRSDPHGVASHLYLQQGSTPTRVPHVLLSAPAPSFQRELAPIPVVLLLSPLSLRCY